MIIRAISEVMNEIVPGRYFTDFHHHELSFSLIDSFLSEGALIIHRQKSI